MWYWSDFIPVEKGKKYWFTFDYKGKPDVMAWIVGYEKKESTAFGADANAFQEYLKEKTTGKPDFRGRLFESFINKYKWRGQLNARSATDAGDGWRHFRRDKPAVHPDEALRRHEVRPRPDPALLAAGRGVPRQRAADGIRGEVSHVRPRVRPQRLGRRFRGKLAAGIDEDKMTYQPARG